MSSTACLGIKWEYWANGGVTVTNNLLYCLSGALYSESKATDWITWGASPVLANPLLVNPPTSFALQSGSPAINTGSSTSAPATDYIGTARPQGAGYDIGAYEYVSSTGVGGITNFKALPTDTTMSLKWTQAAGYTSTVIQYSTSSQPATPSDGTNIYNGTGNNYKQTGLTPGTNYYYSAWGYDGSNYSPITSDGEIMMTTKAGGSTGDVLPTPPAVIPDAPSSKGWFAGLQPFSGFVQGFENAWGMATDTMPFTIGVLILLVVGVGIYLKTKSPFVAIVADFAIDLGLVAMGLLSPYTIGVVLAFGLGIWALENIWI
jgi:hypothetical protein